MGREQLFAWFFFATFLFVLYQFYQIFHFFLASLAWAAILAILFFPVQRRLRAMLRQRDGLAAFVLTTLVIGTVMVPMVYLIILLAMQSMDLVQTVRDGMRSGTVIEVIERWKTALPADLLDSVAPVLAEWSIDFPTLALRLSNTISAFLVAQATEIATNAIRFFVNFFFATFALFFFFRDGEKMVEGFRELLPMEPAHKDAILLRLHETLSAVLQGTLLTAIVQGILCGLAYWALGVPFALLLSGLTAFVSLLPFGTGIAWASVTAYLVYDGEYIRALIMFLWGALIVSSADNVIRPLIIGSRAQIPTVFLFFGILGGLQAYGFLGLFLGPALIGVVVAFIRIYREAYVPLPVPGSAKTPGKESEV